MDAVFSLDCFIYFSSCPCNIKEVVFTLSFKCSKEILYWIVIGTIGMRSLQRVNNSDLIHLGEMQICVS